ncbi:MAG: ribonuclease J [Saccharofermentans sp.]|nr:ribonuclease J [Saccharofermentans sp.]
MKGNFKEKPVDKKSTKVTKPEKANTKPKVKTSKSKAKSTSKSAKSSSKSKQATPNDQVIAKALAKQKKKMGNKSEANKPKLRIIPLGGMSEIGKNMTAFEYGNDIIVIDVGMAFAEENTPGVDCIIQDYSYIRANQDKLRAVVLTHGHEDHIGALPYFLREFQCPVYGGKLTVELVRHKLNDKGVKLTGINLQAMDSGDTVKLGNNFQIEFIRVNHSIADSYAIAIKTPVGLVVHSGDFKVDYTPINGGVIDLQRFAELGRQGVLLFMCESTNIEKDGFSPSEMMVRDSFMRIFQNTKGRIIVATFSSHVHRMQQIFEAAEKYNRHVALSGRSMITVFNVANSLGYLDMKPDTLIDISNIDQYDDDEIVILTTGSQAEPMSALSRMAFASHKAVEIREGDTVIISAHPIPGNEKPIYRVINELFKRGASVVYESLAEVHVSGHAYRNEIKMLHALLKPKYFVPVHGEYRMLFKHVQLAQELGTPAKNTFIMNNGDVLAVGKNSAEIVEHIPANPVLIDGSASIEPDDHVMNDRKLLGADGCVAIALTVDDSTGELACVPVVNSIGFVFDDEKAMIHKDCAARVMALLSTSKRKHENIEAEVATRAFKMGIRDYMFEKTKRRPLIITNVCHINERWY